MTVIAAGVVAIAALALGGAAIAAATQGDDGEALTGTTLQRASAAALKATGGGRVTETEHDSENGATYEVEVTKADGSQVDVRLDGSFNVVVVEGDHEESDDSDSGE
ncbi:MAG: PepSY domain-containing protein [Gaiellaceae bacterium]